MNLLASQNTPLKTMHQKVKMQYVHFKLNATYFIYLGRFLKKLADNQCSSITKGSM